MCSYVGGRGRGPGGGHSSVMRFAIIREGLIGCAIHIRPQLDLSGSSRQLADSGAPGAQGITLRTRQDKSQRIRRSRRS